MPIALSRPFDDSELTGEPPADLARAETPDAAARLTDVAIALFNLAADSRATLAPAPVPPTPTSAWAPARDPAPLAPSSPTVSTAGAPAGSESNATAPTASESMAPLLAPGLAGSAAGAMKAGPLDRLPPTLFGPALGALPGPASTAATATPSAPRTVPSAAPLLPGLGATATGRLAPAARAQSAWPAPAAATPATDTDPDDSPPFGRAASLGLFFLKVANAFHGLTAQLAASPTLKRQDVPGVFAGLGAAVRAQLPYWARPAFDATCRDCAAKVDKAVAARDKAAFDRYARETADLAIGQAAADRAEAARAGDAIGVDRADWYLGILRRFRALYGPDPAAVSAEPAADPAPAPAAAAELAPASEPAPQPVSSPPTPEPPPADTEHGDGDGGDPDIGTGDTKSSAEAKEGSEPPVTAADRRFPDPAPAVGDDINQMLPGGPPHESNTPLRALRGHLLGLQRLALAHGDGTPLMSDAEVGDYIEAAKAWIRPEHFAVFEFTVLAVRAGVVHWHAAVEKLTEHYAPESTGEALLDFAVDALPVVGNIKSFVQFGLAMKRLGEAARQGDEQGVAIFAAMAAGELAGVAFGGIAGKGAKLLGNKLKIQDTLRRLAAREIDYAEAKAILGPLDRFEWHHVLPKFLIGPNADNLIHMPRSLHRELHRDLVAFLKEHRSQTGQNLVPSVINRGLRIQRKNSPESRLQALAAFHALPENRHKYKEVVDFFFKNFPELAK